MMIGKVFLLALVVVLAQSARSENQVCCPMGWMGYNGYCYRYFTYKVSYADALNHCKSLGADIVSIQSSNENSLINGLSQGQEIWIGLTDVNHDGTFSWTDGTPFTYNRWNSDQPNGLSRGQYCAGMSWRDHADGTWHDIGCSYIQNFVCKNAGSKAGSENQVCCPMGWMGYNGYCYHYFTYKSTYDIARNHCKSVGADIVSIHSFNENSLVNGLSDGQEIWIGLTDVNHDGTFTWTDGTPFTYNKWNADGQPNGLSRGQYCAGMSWHAHEDGTWHDIGCNHVQNFVCKNAGSENQVYCPMGWMGYNGYCYRYFTFKSTYDIARNHCKSVGADIVSIHSFNENSLVNGLSDGQEIWIGLTDVNHDGTFSWTDGTPFTYNKWNSDGQPNGLLRGTNQYCAGMSWRDHADGTWHDVGCDYVQYFVCKK